MFGNLLLNQKLYICSHSKSGRKYVVPPDKVLENIIWQLTKNPLFNNDMIWHGNKEAFTATCSLQLEQTDLGMISITLKLSD